MFIVRYVVTVCTPDAEHAYDASMIASYVQDALLSDSNSGVTAAVVEAEYKGEGVVRFDIREDA